MKKDTLFLTSSFFSSTATPITIHLRYKCAAESTAQLLPDPYLIWNLAQVAVVRTHDHSSLKFLDHFFATFYIIVTEITTSREIKEQNLTNQTRIEQNKQNKNITR